MKLMIQSLNIKPIYIEETKSNVGEIILFKDIAKLNISTSPMQFTNFTNMPKFVAV